MTTRKKRICFCLIGTTKKTQISSKYNHFCVFYFLYFHISNLKRYWTSSDKLTDENWAEVRAAIAAKKPGVSQRIKIPTVAEQVNNMDP